MRKNPLRTGLEAPLKAGSNRIFLPGNRYLVWFLTYLSSFAPLSTDMYLPALPNMAETLQTTDELVAWSMTSFFLIYAFSSLVWGPLSDKFGRKKVLICGSVIYMLACVFIALTDSIWELLVMRGCQAIGCAAASAVSLAVVKDVLKGQLMEKLVSFMQAAHILAPLSAPLIGGAMLYVMSWRGVFWAQVLCGGIALAGALCLKETRRAKEIPGLGAAFARIRAVLANSAFLKPWLIFSAMTMPFMSFLAVSAFVYQQQFGLSPQAFSLFFALNAGFSLFAPLAHLYWFRHLHRSAMISWELFIVFCSACLILLFGSYGPWLFAALMAPITFCGGAMRPPATVIMMEANRGDNGAVSALIQFGALLFASFSMFLAPLPFWPAPVLAIGTIAASVSGLCFLCWRALSARNKTG